METCPKPKRPPRPRLTSRPSRTIGVIESVSGELSPRFLELSRLPLPARTRNSGRPLGEPTLQCSTSMTRSLPARMPVVDREPTDTIVTTENQTKTLLERIGVDDHHLGAHLHPPSDTKSTRCSTRGRNKNYSPLSLSRRISNAPTVMERAEYL